MMLSSCNANANMPGLQQPQDQLNSYSSMYPGAQSYEGWPGMALKQIMGQIDLLNFPGQNYNSSGKWGMNKDFQNNQINYETNTGGYGPLCGRESSNGMIQPPVQQQQQQQPQQAQQAQSAQSAQQQQLFKCSYECPQVDNEAPAAWLGPQLWNRKIGIDVSSNEGTNQVKESSMNFDANKIIKSEVSTTPEMDWFNNNSIKSCDDTLSEITDPGSILGLDEEFTAADLALASAPGLAFDPRTSFTPEELKPQPIIRKRRKTYVADSEKNEEYWAKRVKNNVAARRSREARRLKENQIALRAAFLERENSALRSQVQVLNDKNLEMKKDVEKLLMNIKTLQESASQNQQLQQQQLQHQ